MTVSIYNFKIKSSFKNYLMVFIVFAYFLTTNIILHHYQNKDYSFLSFYMDFEKIIEYLGT